MILIYPFFLVCNILLDISVIPLGLLSDPHFSMKVPKYLNVASLGLTLSHEIWHSLDRTGRDFDQMGTLSNWWDQSSEAAFQNVSQCIRDQYREHFKRPLRIDSRSITIEV